MKIKKILLFSILSLFISIAFLNIHFRFSSSVSAETEQEKLEKLGSEIEQYEQEIEKLKSQASTLSNQIAQYDAQIRVTQISQNIYLYKHDLD